MISLPAALQSALTVGGVTKESDTTAAITSVTVDYIGKLLTFTVQQGATAGQVFAPGQYPPSYVFVINLTTGVWFVNGSVLSGTLAGAALTNLQTTFLNLRNTGEAFVLAQNLFPSATQTNWTTV